MRVLVNDNIEEKLSQFYAISMALHPTLDQEVVDNKMRRLLLSLHLLGRYADSLPYATTKQEWIDNHYRDYHKENFHFAYRVEVLSNAERVVVVYDVCHDLLYY